MHIITRCTNLISFVHRNEQPECYLVEVISVKNIINDIASCVIKMILSTTSEATRTMMYLLFVLLL